MSIDIKQPVEINTAPRPPRTKTVTARQFAANRANSQKSTGPSSPAGRERARFNSLKHGLTAKEVCLPGESREEFHQRRREYAEIFHPKNLLEWDILDDLVSARWRKERAVKYEKCLLLEKFMQRRANIGEHYDSITLDVEAALAFRELSDGSTVLKNLDRYETRILRAIQTDWNLLMELRGHRPPAAGDPQPLPESTADPDPEPEIPSLQNEAIPISGHPENADPTPLINATQTTVIPKRPPAERPNRPLVAHATAASSLKPLTTDYHPLTTTKLTSQPPELTTDN